MTVALSVVVLLLAIQQVVSTATHIDIVPAKKKKDGDYCHIYCGNHSGICGPTKAIQQNKVAFAINNMGQGRISRITVFPKVPLLALQANLYSPLTYLHYLHLTGTVITHISSDLFLIHSKNYYNISM
jgi:hypothetical protein